MTVEERFLKEMCPDASPKEFAYMLGLLRDAHRKARKIRAIKASKEAENIDISKEKEKHYES